MLTPLIAAAAALASALPSGSTSTYTTLDLKRCTVLERGTEDDWSVWRCPGYRGVPLIVESGDGRHDIDAGTRDKDGHWSSPFDDIPARVEWRVDRGRPFAIIYRLTVATPERPRTSRLLVETIGRPGRPGCRVADIPGSARDANARARRAADRIRAKTATCLSAP